MTDSEDFCPGGFPVNTTHIGDVDVNRPMFWDSLPRTAQNDNFGWATTYFLSIVSFSSLWSQTVAMDKLKTGSKAAFDKGWGYFEKLGAPVNKLTNKIGSEAFWPTTLDKECDKAARILKSFCSKLRCTTIQHSYTNIWQRMDSTPKSTSMTRRPWQRRRKDLKENREF